MGFIVCSCGWKSEVVSCIEAERVICSISHRCPSCLFSRQFRYISGN